ncbi:MAG: DUF4430 domain-containing protein [Candidatus Liptonbacteria bacterium]
MVEKKKLWSWTTSGVVLGLVAGILIGWSYQPVPVSAPTGVLPGAEQKTVSLMIDYGEGSVQTYNKIEIRPGQSVLDMLRDTMATQKLMFESKEYAGMGTLVTRIHSRANGENNNYWQYWVNNEKPNVGADTYKLQGGEWIAWKFMPFTQE